MNTKLNFFKTAGIIALALVVANCGKSKENDPHHIKVGVATGPEYKVAEAAKKVAKDKYGLEVELVSFNDYVIPNEALSQGDIDVNAFQHKPYLDEQAKQRGYKLAIIGKTFIYPIAAYSKKIKNISELKNESTIIIPNDPTNGGRSLLLLEKNGLLKLKEGIGLLPKVTDIVSNPKNLKILELEAPQLPRALDDANVSIAIINNTFASQAGLIPSRDALFVEDKDSPYVNLVVSREDNKNEEKVKQFLQAFQSAEVEQAAIREFKGGAVKGW
ncbi:methionine ABC transporter substrate-binding lipoprotein MetQ [Flavobacterium chilense]|uniref:Lipoprotein n=1 Tax=Flavobacterium chilense TaxID=946677 RepID=A0A1M7ESY5_9FLAO|nr:methionine ABC transporter substrate-binding lipoprotein MetQ [Flavobacterium chilense]SHL94955.1 D-methionine transport system substrate-binding protein [Flavobacterium chilense]